MEGGNESISLLLVSPKHQKKKRVAIQKPITIQTLRENITLAFQLSPEEKVVNVVGSDDVDIETDFDCKFLQPNQELKVFIEVKGRIYFA